jgi:hypothetical protein
MSTKLLQLPSTSSKNSKVPSTSTTKQDKINFIILFALFLFTFEFFFREQMTLMSNFLLKSSFETGLKSNCLNLKRLQLFESHGRYIIFIFVLNFSNTLGGLSIIFLDALSIFINGHLKLLYTETRPYWTDPDIIPCKCSANYGNPSTTGFNQFIIFAVAYKCLTTVNKTWNKFLVGLVCSIPVIGIFASRYFQGVHSLNQLFFGLGLGYILYYTFFEIFEVDINDKKLFFYIIKNLWKICFSLLGLFLLATLNHLMMHFPKDPDWIKTIEKYCEIIPFNSFDNESFRKSTKVFLFIGCLVGLWLENKFFFKNDLKNFINYNIDTEKKFCNTGYVITVIRIFLVYQFYFLFARFLVDPFSDEKKHEILFVLIWGYIIPSFVYGILIFFVYKWIMKKMGLTNENLRKFSIEEAGQGYYMIEDENTDDITDVENVKERNKKEKGDIEMVNLNMKTDVREQLL